MRRLNDNAPRRQPGGIETGNKRADGSTCRIHPTTTARARQELRAANGKVAAWVTGDALCKQIDGSRHMLRSPRAIAFDLDIIKAAEAAGAVRALVRDRESGDVYRASLADFRRFSIQLDRGFGLQLALPLNFWTLQRAGEPVQLSLL